MYEANLLISAPCTRSVAQSLSITRSGLRAISTEFIQCALGKITLLGLERWQKHMHLVSPGHLIVFSILSKKSWQIHLTLVFGAYAPVFGKIPEQIAFHFQQKKIPYGVARSETRPVAVARGPFTYSEAHMGRILGEPSEGVWHFGKNWKKIVNKKFTNKNAKWLDFAEIRRITTMVAPLNAKRPLWCRGLFGISQLPRQSFYSGTSPKHPLPLPDAWRSNMRESVAQCLHLPNLCGSR